MKNKSTTKKHLKNAGLVFALLTAICLVIFSSAASDTGALKGSEPDKPSLTKHKKYAELNCDDCHSTTKPKRLTTEQCLSCHGSLEEIAEATKHLDPDPHNSPHYGNRLDCDLCHHEHYESENFCSQCHEWKLVIP